MYALDIIDRVVSNIEKQKMFAAASIHVKDDTDVVWATDLDEFFETELINEIEVMYKNDSKLISIDLPHRIFVYNQYKIFYKQWRKNLITKTIY